MRVVFLSDTFKELPKNTSSAFQVRLPEPFFLQLEDGSWEVGLSSDALTEDRTANVIEAAYVLNGHQLKWASVSLADLDPFTINEGVELMKVIVYRIQWTRTWNAQLSRAEFRMETARGFVGKETI